MRKRLLLVLFLSFLFFMGHTSNYEVVIDKNIDEKIDISISSGDLKNPSNFIGDVIDQPQRVFLSSDSDVMYDKKVEKNDDITLIHLKHTYTPKEFSNAKYFNTCFENTTYIYKHDYIYVKGYDGFNCANSSENPTVIKIKTDKFVMKHNADKVDGNTYIWKVNLKDQSKFELEFQVDLKKSKEYIPKKKQPVISTLKIAIGIIIGFAIVVIIIVIYKERSNSD